MLRILKRDGQIVGHNYIRPFNRYHDPNGSNIFLDIANHAKSGKTVFIEMARADETIRKVISERVCSELLTMMMTEFTNGTLNEKFVIIYFEEAHTLFEKSDSNLNNIYNKLAKEGAKFHISMVYATQSMTTLVGFT